MALTRISNQSLTSVTALPAAISTGKVLQSVSATDTTERNTTSNSFVTASNGLTVNITPSATSSKIFVTVSTSLYSYTANKSVYLTLYRDSTNLGNAQGLIRSLNQDGTGGGAGTFAVLDSPNTTSQVTYQLYIRLQDMDSDGGSVHIGSNIQGSTDYEPTHMTAFEIGA